MDKTQTFKRPRSTRTLLLILLIGAVAISTLAWLARNKHAPESSYTLLDGSRGTTSDLVGKLTLVKFWATSCVICVGEMPALIATHRQYADRGFEILAVAMSYDNPVYVNNFAKSRQLPFKVALDIDGSMAREWGDIQVTPTAFLLNPQGQIIERYVGPTNIAQLEQKIQEILPR